MEDFRTTQVIHLTNRAVGRWENLRKDRDHFKD